MAEWTVKITLNSSKVHPSQYTANNPGSALFLAWEHLRNQSMVSIKDVKSCEVLERSIPKVS